MRRRTLQRIKTELGFEGAEAGKDYKRSSEEERKIMNKAHTGPRCWRTGEETKPARSTTIVHTRPDHCRNLEFTANDSCRCVFCAFRWFPDVREHSREGLPPKGPEFGMFSLVPHSLDRYDKLFTSPNDGAVSSCTEDYVQLCCTHMDRRCIRCPGCSPGFRSRTGVRGEQYLVFT